MQRVLAVPVRVRVNRLDFNERREDMHPVTTLIARRVCSRFTRLLSLCGLLIGESGAARHTLQAQQPLLVPLAEMHHTAWTYADSMTLGGAPRIIESNDGYLWLASSRGLIRFDGVRFAVVDSGFAPALRATRAGSYQPRMVDRDGTLWISRPDGALVTYRDGRFTVRTHPESGRSPRVMQDNAGTFFVWTGGEIGLREMNPNGQLSEVKLPFGSNTRINSVIKDSSDGLWIGTEPIGLWHRSHGNWSQINIPPAYAIGSATPLLQSHDGTLWVGMGDALFRFSGDRWTRFSLPSKPSLPLFANQIVEDGDGSIWIASKDNGVLRWSGQHVESLGLSDGLSGVDGLSVHVNTAGVVWVSTGGGIDRLRVSALAPLTSDVRTPLSSSVRLVQDVSGFAWAQGQSARTLGRVEGGPIDGSARPLSIKQLPFPDMHGSGYQILAPSRTGGAWIAPHNGGLERVTDHGFERADARLSLPPGRFWQLLEARDSSMWLATLWGGLGRVANGRYAAVSLGDLVRPKISSLAEDATGHIWISSDNSPNVFEFAGNRLVRRFNAETGLRDTILRLIHEHGDTVWGVGTSSIVRFAGGRASTVRLPTITFVRGYNERVRTQGVPSLGAFVAGDALWVAGEGGIAHFSLPQLAQAISDSTQIVDAEVVTAADGISAPVARGVTLEPVTRTNNGRFWIRTPTGFATLDPSRLPGTQKLPRPIIEEISSAGHRLPIDSL
ncbi:MAG: hypothetical protein ABI852_16510, partial [Gemmatimonadaceae bacterium]